MPVWEVVLRVLATIVGLMLVAGGFLCSLSMEDAKWSYPYVVSGIVVAVSAWMV